MGTYLCQQTNQNQPTNSLSILTRHQNQPYKSSTIPILKQQNISLTNNHQYFPCQYLGKGIFGTTITVFLKQQKQQIFIQHIINIKTDWITRQILFLNPILFQKINNQEYFVHVKNIKAQKNRLYVLKQLYKYGNLYNLIKRYPKIKDSTFVEISIKIILILQKLHQKNIIYRSLRPQNIIFINQNGDFKLSEIQFSVIGQQAIDYIGAAVYTPPQIYKQDSGGRYDKSIDSWMLGVLLYQMLTGRTPFDAPNLSQIKQNVLNFHSDNLKFPTQNKITQDLTDFITKLLNPQPNCRITFDQMKRHHYFHGKIMDPNLQIPNLFDNIKLAKDQNITANRIVYSKIQNKTQFKIQNYQQFYNQQVSH